MRNSSYEGGLDEGPGEPVRAFIFADIERGDSRIVVRGV